jgi:hypothetical protein
MSSNHYRCPAGHTFYGPESDLHAVWTHAHRDHEAQPVQINATTDQERLRTSPQSPNATHVISSPEDAR